MDKEDLDALIDDENEMETYIDEDEEDMAFLAEQDDEGEEGEYRKKTASSSFSRSGITMECLR